MSFWQITDNLEKKSKLIAKKRVYLASSKGLFLGNWSDYNKSQKYFDTVSKIDGTLSSIFCQEWIQSSAELNTQSSVERWRHIIQQHQLSATAPYFFDRVQNIVCCGMEFFHYDNPDVKILSREVWERDREEHQNPQESMILLLL